MRKRVRFAFITLSLVAVILVASVVPTMIMVKAAAATFAATELLGRPTDTSVTVNVVPSSNGQVYFKYGTTSGVYTDQTSSAGLTSGSPTEVLIQGLTPNTRYYYRLVSSGDGVNWEDGDEHSFQTQRSQGSTFNFTITSDSHVDIMLGNAAMWTQTMTNVANDHPDFEIDLGDTFAMDSVTTAAGAEQVYLYQREFFDIVGHSASIFLVSGNHEQQEAWHLDDTGNPATSQPVIGLNAQKKYYVNPVPDAFYSGNPDDSHSYVDGDHLLEDYYAWTWGDALLVVIDPYWYTTTKPYTGNTGGGESSDVGSGDRWDWTLGLEQFNWLKQTLEESQAAYKFIFAHHMVGGSQDYVRGGAVPAHICEWGGYNEDGTTWGWDTERPVAQWGSDPVHQILVENHVSAFFHGHDHQYAYEMRDGVVYQSMPAAGFSGNGFNIYSEGTYTLEVLPSPGHLRVSISPSQTTVDYVQAATSGGTNGQVVHSYTIDPSIAPVEQNAYLTVRGGNNAIYHRTFDKEADSWGSWFALPSGATPKRPATAVASGKLYFVVNGGDDESLWFSSVTLEDSSFSGWTMLTGASQSPPTLASNGTHLALVVQGMNNMVYYRTYDVDGASWSAWAGLPGATSGQPAAAMLGDKLHVVVLSESQMLWHGSVNLDDDSFTGWTMIAGSTDAAPSLTASSTLNAVYLGVKGLNGAIYLNEWSGSWQGWTPLATGSTGESPTIAVTNDVLQVVVKGLDGASVWHCNMNLNTDVQSSWQALSGFSPSAPTMAS
jgi:hypothetical protein